MSSIYLKDGIFWYLRYIPNPESGRNDKRLYRSTRTRDRNEALIRKSNFDEKYDAIYRKNSLFPTRTLSECKKTYLAEKKSEILTRKRSQNTYNSEVISLKQFSEFVTNEYNDPNIRDIAKLHILEFKKHRESSSKVKSSSTVSLNLRVIRSFFSYCINKGYIEHHPFEQIKIKKSLRREEWPIGKDFDDLMKIFRKLVRRPFPNQKKITYGKHRKKEDKQWIYDHEWFPYVIWIILNTGMRIGEVLMLKWKQGKGDVGTGHSYSYSYLSKDCESLTIHFKRGKRILPVKHLKPIFNKIPRSYVDKKNDPERTRKKMYVFENIRTHDDHLTTTAAGLWKRFLGDFELNENWTIHSLRHGVASAILNSGRTHFEAGNVLGHSTTEMIDRYGHATISNLEETLSVLHRVTKKK